MAKEPKEYDEIRLRYWKIGVDRYFVLANGSACASEVADLEGSPVYHQELHKLLLEEFREKQPGPGSLRQRLRGLGTEITKRLLPGSLLSCLEKCFEVSERHGRGLRLRFEMPPELSTIPLELLRSPTAFLASHQSVSIVRSVVPKVFGTSSQPLADKVPLTVVLAGASPKNPRYPDISKSIRAEFTSIKNLLPKGQVPPPLLNASRKTIGERLAQVRGESVVVISAHGKYDEHAGEGFVILEDEEGNEDVVGEELLAGLLARPGVRLVVLDLCRGAESNLYDPFSGIAGRLTSYGIPMVVAYQHRVSVAAASRFSPELFAALVKKCWLDEACTVARSHIGDRLETSIEWCTPVMYLVQRCYNSQLIGSRNQRSRKFPSELGWEVSRNSVMEGLRLNPGDGDLLALHREASIELDLAHAIANICEDWNAKRPVLRALSRINKLQSSAHRDLLKPLNEFMGYDPGDGEPLLKQLIQKLKDEGGWFLLHGEPGVGKSRLAELAHEELERWGYSVIHLPCAGLTAAEILTALLRKAGKQPSIRDYARQFTTGAEWKILQIEDLKRRLQAVKAIIILDDVSNKEIASFLPKDPASVIFASCLRHWDFIGVDRSFEVKPFTSEQADRLLTRTVAESNHTRNIEAFRQAWKLLTEKVDGSPEALVEAAEVFHHSAKDSEIAAGFLNFYPERAIERWAAAIEHLNEDAKQLLVAFAACARQGTELQFGGEVAGIKGARLTESRRILEEASLLRCVAVQRQYYALHPLLRTTLEETEGWKAACMRHLSILKSKIEMAGDGKVDWLGEIGIAVRRHLDHDRHNPTLVLIHKAVDRLVESALVDTVHEGASPELEGWIDRHHYLRGKLFHVAARLLQARRYQEPPNNSGKVKREPMTSHPISIPKLEEWHETWRSGRQRELHFQNARDILEREARILWRERDWLGFSNNCEIRAWVLDKLGNRERSQRLLRLCARKMAGQSADKHFHEDGSQPSWVWWSVDAEWASNVDPSQAIHELRPNWAKSFSSYAAAFNTGQNPSENAEQSDIAGTGEADTADSSVSSAKTEMTEEMLKIAVAKDALDRLEEEELNWQDPQRLCECYAYYAATLQLCERHEDASQILRKLSPLCRQLGDLQLLRECYEIQGITLGRLGWTELAENMFALWRTVDLALRFEEGLAYLCWHLGVIEALDERNAKAAEYMDEAALRMGAIRRLEEHSELRKDIERVCRKPEEEPGSQYFRASTAEA